MILSFSCRVYPIIKMKQNLCSIFIKHLLIIQYLIFKNNKNDKKHNKIPTINSSYSYQ